MIPYGRQDINQDDIDSVLDVLGSEFLTQGPLVPEFERSLADYCGASYGVATNSATSALHIACLALEVGVGDLVWTTPITFVASANCARYCGADVDFVDIDPRTYNISVDRLAEKLEMARAANRLPKVLIPVHLTGQSCEMKDIYALSLKYGFYIIEDASHAIGGSYLGCKIGSCQFSDITVFSFHPVKIITSGEGGMAMTNDVKKAKIMARLRSHGITRYSSEMTHESDGPWYYQQLELGFNYRLTELQAALGLSQLSRLDDFVEKRHSIAARYGKQLQTSGIVLPWQHPDTYSAYHLYVIRVPAENRREAFEKMQRSGVGVNVHYIPIYRQPYYMGFGYKCADFPEAERYYNEAISIPIYYKLTDDQQDDVVGKLVRSSGHQTIF